MNSWLPTPEQELLLQAALGVDGEVSRHWLEWRRRVNLDDVELASFRLLPLAYLNLLEHGIEDPDLGRLKGVYRQAWARTQLQQQGLDEALRLLHGAGIETMLLKGSALLHCVYSSPAARTMEDLDVLVAPERARRAIDTLVASGWDIYPDEVIPDSRLPLMHAVHLTRQLAEWINIDLHRRAIAWRYHGDDDFWSASTPLEVRGIPTRLPSPTHLLLGALVRAGQTPGQTTIRWVPDSVLILRRLEVDWDGSCRSAFRGGSRRAWRSGCASCRDASPRSRPTVIESLERVRAPRYERRELARRRHQTGPLAGLEFHRSNYRCVTGEHPTWQRAVQFPAYLRDWWGLGSTWSVPAEGARRLVSDGSPGLRSRRPLEREVRHRDTPDQRRHPDLQRRAVSGAGPRQRLRPGLPAARPGRRRRRLERREHADRRLVRGRPLLCPGARERRDGSQPGCRRGAG